ncbi:MAG: glycosyltransferase family 39 protein, partial [Deltaproteobacteria bacterium]|nr:glycosyltransferase family 39 protein [Deltaproteobacteria bacterium]
RDALTYHLAVPKLYLKYGAMYEIPTSALSYNPMNLELLYMIPLSLGNDIIPKFIHFSFAILTAWLIFSYLRRRTGPVYGLFGAVFFLSIPVAVKLSITAYVDLGLVFFTTASLLLLLRWMENGFRMRTLIFSAVFCGLALGTKYNGLVTFFLLIFFVPFAYSRYNQEKRSVFLKSSQKGLVFFFIAILIFSPWMIRNYKWKNNPIYPLYDNRFNPPKELVTKATARDGIKKQSHGLFTYRKVIYHEKWWQIALLPVRVFFQGKDGNPQYFDGKMNPSLLFLPILAFYRKREGPKDVRDEKRILLAFSVLFFGFAFFSSVLRMRYIAPIIPPLVILSVFGIRNIIEKVQEFNAPGVRRAGFCLIFLTLAFFLSLNMHYIITQFRYVAPFSYLKGELSRDEYIDKYVPEYPVIRYINEKLPRNAKILFIFLGKRGYYCDKKYRLDSGLFFEIMKRSDSPEQVLSELKNMGITHLLIRYDIFKKWKKDNFSDNELYLLDQFMVKYSKMLFIKRGFGVSRLGSASP